MGAVEISAIQLGGAFLQRGARPFQWVKFLSKSPIDRKRIESLMWVDPYDLSTENPQVSACFLNGAEK